MTISFISRTAAALITFAALSLIVMPAPAQPPPTSIVKVSLIWPGVAPGMTNSPTEEPPPSDRGSYVGVVKPTLTMYLAANPNGAGVLILPGGSYKKIVRADTECSWYARWLNSLGIDAYVLKYRLPMESFNPPVSAYQDAQRALRLIRSNVLAGEYGHHTDPRRIGVMGFSAGGHLAAVMGTYYDTAFYDPVDEADRLSARPDFMILGSAAIFPDVQLRVPAEPTPKNAGFRRFLAVIGDYPIQKAVNARTPPAFIFHGSNDPKVPVARAVAMAKWLDAAKVPVALHIISKAGHSSWATEKGPLKEWAEPCEAWLRAGGIIPN